VKWRYSATLSLTLALDGGEWSASCLCSFTPRERVSGAHWIGGWVGPRAGLDAVVKRKIPSPCRDSNRRSSSPWPSATSLSFLGSLLVCGLQNSYHPCSDTWTQPPVQWTPGALSPMVKRPGHESDHFHLVSRSIKRGVIITPPHTCSWGGAWLSTQTNLLILPYFTSGTW
jgi:hypothetical protein